MKKVSRAALAAVLLVALSACGNQGREASPLVAAVSSVAKSTVGQISARRSGGKTTAAAAKKPLNRAAIEKFDMPILRTVIPVRSADVLLTINDVKGGTVTWATTDGTTLTLRDGVLIQTRGFGPDLMSAEAPSAEALRTNGGTHRRVYYFLGEDDQPSRRSYDCTVSLAGSEQIKIYGRSHNVTKSVETCARPQGSITNTFWFEGATIRKSQQLVSGGVGFVDFEKVVD